MADRSAIEWTDATWNPIRARNTANGRVGWHCVHASEGCRNCYAERQNRAIFGNGLEYKPGLLSSGAVELFLDERMLLAPLRWRRGRRVFVCSMTDLFADFVPAEWITRIFEVMAAAPRHQFQVLTKRPARMRELITGLAACGEHWPLSGQHLPEHPLPNVWLGTSIEDRNNLLQRAGDLRQTPAANRFFSCEPLLGDLGDVLLDGIDWVIAGGESGPDARPMLPDWARSLRDQCGAAGVPFFFKQWGEWAPLQRGGEQVPNVPDIGLKVGKKAAGRLLDGVEHNGMPA